MNSNESFERHKASVEGINLGNLIEHPEQAERDAIHMAVAPMVSGESSLSPGTFVALDDNRRAYQVWSLEEAVGIVDPFLRHEVYKGDWFWLILKPGSITNLRHHWTHPSFVEAPRPITYEDHEDYECRMC